MILEKEKIIYLDEYGCQIYSRTGYGYSEIGKSASTEVAQILSANYSICGAMKCDSLFFFEIQNKPYNIEDFKMFLEKLIYWLGVEQITGAYLVMDNVPFHKKQEIKDFITESGHNYVYLPPYSPFLNPIENMFSKWKNGVKKRKSQSEDELYENIHAAAGDISNEDCQNYFLHMQKYIIRCLRKEIILN